MVFTERQILYEKFLHEVMKPASVLRRQCREQEEFHQCAYIKQVDLLIDRAHEIVLKLSQGEEQC